uniref:Fatty acid desaturase 6 n=1 Tax=Chrysemys picta bellii TaxID=8478 RepID=A0A8C3IZ23_CHRPI
MEPWQEMLMENQDMYQERQKGEQPSEAGAARIEPLQKGSPLNHGVEQPEPPGEGRNAQEKGEKLGQGDTPSQEIAAPTQQLQTGTSRVGPPEQEVTPKGQDPGPTLSHPVLDGDGNTSGGEEMPRVFQRGAKEEAEPPEEGRREEALMGELSELVQQVVKRSSWWERHGIDDSIIALNFLILPAGFLCLRSDNALPFLLGIFILGIVHHTVTVKGSHLASHNALTESKSWGKVWAIFFLEHIGLPMFSADKKPKRIHLMSLGVLNLPRNALLDWSFGHSIISCHVEHHLFPNLSDNMCLKIKPIVSQYLKKKKLPYNEDSYMSRLQLFLHRYEELMVNAPPITELVGIQ